MGESNGVVHGASALNTEVALARLGGDRELLREIAALFIDDSDRMVGEIERALVARNAFALDRAAHTLKGCALNFGAQRVSEAARSLERIARSGDLSAASTVYETLRSELNQLLTELRGLAGRPAAGV